MRVIKVYSSTTVLCSVKSAKPVMVRTMGGLVRENNPLLTQSIFVKCAQKGILVTINNEFGDVT